MRVTDGSVLPADALFGYKGGECGSSPLSVCRGRPGMRRRNALQAGDGDRAPRRIDVRCVVLIEVAKGSLVQAAMALRGVSRDVDSIGRGRRGFSSQSNRGVRCQRNRPNGIFCLGISGSLLLRSLVLLAQFSLPGLLLASG